MKKSKLHERLDDLVDKYKSLFIAIYAISVACIMFAIAIDHEETRWLAYGALWISSALIVGVALVEWLFVVLILLDHRRPSKRIVLVAVIFSTLSVCSILSLRSTGAHLVSAWINTILWLVLEIGRASCRERVYRGV